MGITEIEKAATSAIEIRECTTVEELDSCVRLQREVFGLPELEISPRRHLIVSRNAGGWVLGAFEDAQLVGFVLHLVAASGNEILGYSHMMAVAASHQNKGVGARLKWSQRRRALEEGRERIKWTFEPMRARNAHFNLNRLGAVIRRYEPNFYGTDYATQAAEQGTHRGLDSDRLIVEWNLSSARVEALSRGIESPFASRVEATVSITPNWTELVRDDVMAAQRDLVRVRKEFISRLETGLVCAGFDRSLENPEYLFYKPPAEP